MPQVFWHWGLCSLRVALCGMRFELCWDAFSKQNLVYWFVVCTETLQESKSVAQSNFFGAGSVGRFCLGSLLVSAWYWTVISYLDVLSVIVSYLCITAAFFLQSNCISVVSTDVLVSLISQGRADGRAFKSHFHCYQWPFLVLAE